MPTIHGRTKQRFGTGRVSIRVEYVSIRVEYKRRHGAESFRGLQKCVRTEAISGRACIKRGDEEATNGFKTIEKWCGLETLPLLEGEES